MEAANSTGRPPHVVGRTEIDERRAEADMTTATQQQGRDQITRTDFQRRAATEPQRAALRGMWGTSHTDRGIYIPAAGEGVIPDARSKGERWCERCQRVSRIMHWMGKKRFRCCGWPA